VEVGHRELAKVIKKPRALPNFSKRNRDNIVGPYTGEKMTGQQFSSRGNGTIARRASAPQFLTKVQGFDACFAGQYLFKFQVRDIDSHFTSDIE